MARASKRRDQDWRMPHAKAVARMDTATLCALLFRVGKQLPPALQEAVTARGADAVEPLLAIACDGEPWQDDERDHWARRHALMLLMEVGDERTVAPMLALVLTLWPENGWLVADGALQALEALGAPALEPMLAAIEQTQDRHTREALIGALAQLGVRDPRIWSQLVAQLTREPACAATNLADYGDEAALPSLHEALANAPIRPPQQFGPMPNRAFIELEDAILRLGGELTPAERDRARVLRALYPSGGRSLSG